jgi:hypothetical protein
MDENIVEKASEIEKFQDKYRDIITDDIKNNLSKDGGGISEQKLKKMIQSFADEEKLLTIGIIGCVKAGKSSLLNSIFFNGKEVLPKAATPMTASLTVLTYGEQFCATVEYFSTEELANIKEEHDRYQKCWEEKSLKIKEDFEARLKKKDKNISPQELGEKVKSQINDAMKGNDNALYDQYERMIKSSLDPSEICARGIEKINAQNLEELMGLMNDYVGSAGKHMPFTKSVEIQLTGGDYESLRNIRVVDTPGINDPIRSREQRTEEYLSQCDVVFIISSADQFMTAADVKLMDRLSSKEGVRELFIVVSKFDNGVLQGSIIKDSKNNLGAAVEKLRKDLSKVAGKVLGTLKKKSPAIRDSKQFDQLINESGGRTLILSGLCYSMSVNFANRNQWDETEEYVWKKLVGAYPSDFDESQKGKESLDLLANIYGIKEKIEKTRQQKDDIILEKQQNYMRQQSANIGEYIGSLEKKLKEKKKTIKNSDLSALEKERQELKDRYSGCAGRIDDAFDKCFDEFKKNAMGLIDGAAEDLFNKKTADVNKNEEVKGNIVIKKIKKTVAKIGFIAFLARLLDLGGYEEQTINEEHKVYVPLMRPGAIQTIVKDIDKELLSQFEDYLMKAKKDWEKSMSRKITAEYEKSFPNEDKLLQQALQNVINAFKIPEFDFSALPAFKASRSGEITGREAVDEFKNEVMNYLAVLKDEYCKITEGILASIENNIKEKKMSDLLFHNIEKQIKELEENIKDREIILRRIEECLWELKRLTPPSFWDNLNIFKH